MNKPIWRNEDGSADLGVWLYELKPGDQYYYCNGSIKTLARKCRIDYLYVPQRVINTIYMIAGTISNCVPKKYEDAVFFEIQFGLLGIAQPAFNRIGEVLCRVGFRKRYDNCELLSTDGAMGDIGLVDPIDKVPEWLEAYRLHLDKSCDC